MASAAGDLTAGLINALTNSTTGVIDIFTEVVQSVGDALEEVSKIIIRSPEADLSKSRRGAKESYCNEQLNRAER